MRMNMGDRKKTPAAEAVLNWQSETLLEQNNAFKAIDSKIGNVQQDLRRYDESTKKILSEFQKRLHALESGQHLGYHYLESPKLEIEKLKRQIQLLEEWRFRPFDPLAPPVKIGYLPPPPQTSIFATIPEDPYRREPDMAEIRNRLKALQKENGKEKIPPTKSSSIVIRERPYQMMLSNPLESFLKDLSTREPDPVIQQPDPLIPEKQILLPVEQTSHNTESDSVSLSSSSSFSIPTIDSLPIAPVTSSIFMADPPDDEMESNYYDPEIGQTSNPAHHVSIASKQFFTIDDMDWHSSEPFFSNFDT